MRHGVLIMMATASIAIADPNVDMMVKIANTGGPGNDPLPIKPRLVLGTTAVIAPADYTKVVDSFGGDNYVKSAHPVVATSADGSAAWVAIDLEFREFCAKASCDHDPPVATGHMTAVFDAGKPIAWNIAKIAKAKAKPPAPSTLPRQIDAAAQDAEKMFESTISDPAALAKSVSDRKDVVLYGSDAGERYLGGAAVRAQLAKWKLGYKVRDGIQAGATANGKVAFVAANVDAARATDKTPTPYRMFAIYEKANDGWRLVQLQFSTPAP
jgi:hypothetical protein